MDEKMTDEELLDKIKDLSDCNVFINRNSLRSFMLHLFKVNNTEYLFKISTDVIKSLEYENNVMLLANPNWNINDATTGERFTWRQSSELCKQAGMKFINQNIQNISSEIRTTDFNPRGNQDKFIRRSLTKNEKKQIWLKQFKKCNNCNEDCNFSEDEIDPYTPRWQTAVKTDKIIHRTANVGDHRSLGLIDRFSKTIKNIVAKHMTRTQTNKWIDKIAPIINAYNKTPHSALNGMTPNEASKNLDKAVHIAMTRRNDAIKAQRTLFNVGDMVRVMLNKNLISKGYEANYSHEVYTITKADGNYYTLNNGKRYRGHMLLKVSPKTVLEDKKDVQAIAKKKQHVRALLKREDIKPD